MSKKLYLAFAFVLVCWISLKWTDRFGDPLNSQMPFDSREWQSARTSFKPYIPSARQRMIGDLVHHILPGKDITKVHALLGLPDVNRQSALNDQNYVAQPILKFLDQHKCDDLYVIGKSYVPFSESVFGLGDFDVDSEYLLIRYDEKGMVKSWWTNCLDHYKLLNSERLPYSP